ncbi:MAG TPA: hypothetical protein VH639_06415 [Bryobacteraceae bacterium]|jgi:hypothetical protein
MQISDIFLRLGEDNFQQLMRSISLGKLKTYQIYDRFKTRLYLTKLNSETLRKSAPRTWTRIGEHDEEFATDIAQAILISHMDMIKAVLDHLGVPHEEGFFAKDANVSEHLKDGWQQHAWEKFRAAFPPAPLLFYINHLAWEMTKAEDVFSPAQPNGAAEATE